MMVSQHMRQQGLEMTVRSQFEESLGLASDEFGGEREREYFCNNPPEWHVANYVQLHLRFPRGVFR